MNVFGDKHVRIVREKLGSERNCVMCLTRTEKQHTSGFSQTVLNFWFRNMTQRPQKGKHSSAQRGLSQLIFTEKPTVAISAQQAVASEGKPSSAPLGMSGTESDNVYLS